MSPKISLISPVYNSDKYLSECIESVLSQTYADFEFILVNDGSTDTSTDIIDRYAQKDKRVKVIDRQNGGVSRARNIGIEQATGEYIAFIDSDDTILPDYLSRHIDALNEGDYDLVCSSMTEFGEGPLQPPVYLKADDWSLDDESRHATFYDLKYLTSPVCKLYKRSIIIDNSLRFDPNLSSAEDKKFNLQYYKCISHVKSLDYNGYRYRKGISDSLSSIKRDLTEVFKVETELWNIKKSDFSIRGHNSDVSLSLIANDALFLINDYIESSAKTYNLNEFKHKISSTDIEDLLHFTRKHQHLLTTNRLQKIMLTLGINAAYLTYRIMKI